MVDLRSLRLGWARCTTFLRALWFAACEARRPEQDSYSAMPKLNIDLKGYEPPAWLVRKMGDGRKDDTSLREVKPGIKHYLKAVRKIAEEGVKLTGIAAEAIVDPEARREWANWFPETNREPTYPLQWKAPWLTDPEVPHKMREVLRGGPYSVDEELLDNIGSAPRWDSSSSCPF